MPHAYEIYIEKETETSFRDFCTHIYKSIHIALYMPHVLSSPTFVSRSPTLLEMKKKMMCGGV